jgi:metal-dependent amidase/aminoacylase/carboxypeptidase family protein
MDALDMTEENYDLPYASKNKGAAHMCGHDGHTACLLSFVPWFISQA